MSKPSFLAPPKKRNFGPEKVSTPYENRVLQGEKRDIRL